MATMTRKSYIQTANILSGFVNEMDPDTYEDLVNEFAEWFKSDNDNFDYARFEKACGIDEIGLINSEFSRKDKHYKEIAKLQSSTKYNVNL
jgi:hypothetical protein